MSTRAQWWDYGWNGAYLITICTRNMEHFFGDIVNSPLIASKMGQCAETIWHEIPNQFEYADLGDFVVMPNHIHGILILDNPGGENLDGAFAVETRLIGSLRQTEQPENPIKTGGITGDKNPMLTQIAHYMRVKALQTVNYTFTISSLCTTDFRFMNAKY